MNWYLGVWKKYACFSGRARRKEYWMFVLFNALIYLVLSILFAVIFKDPQVMSIILGLYGLALIVPALALAVRRLHDIGKSGAWIFITFVPLVGQIWYLILMLTEGNAGSNQYGEDPKA